MSDQIDEDLSQERREQQVSGANKPGEQPQRTRHRPPARKRVGVIAALTVTAIVAVVVVIRSGGSQVQRASAQSATPAQSINALLAGIPESGNALGSPRAPVTLEYFGDLECPTARAFTVATLPSIIDKWVRAGELRIEYRSLRTVSEPEVFGIQQVAALAAGRQGKLWYYLEYFYHEQGREHSGYVTEGYLRALARQVPDLNRELWGDYRHDPQLAAQVTEDEQTARTTHLRDTPSFLVGRTGSAPVLRLGQFATLDAINDAVRQALHGDSDRGRAPPTVASFGSVRSRQHAADVSLRDEPRPAPRRERASSDIEQSPALAR
jgi:protein-disulfide isomerase